MLAANRTHRIQHRSSAFVAITGLVLWLSGCVLPNLVVLPPASNPEQPAANSRWVAVEWMHPDPRDVQRFRLYWGTEAGQYLVVEEVGMPRHSGTEFRARFEAPAGQTVHVALTAVGEGGESGFSNIGICPPGCVRARPPRAFGRE